MQPQSLQLPDAILAAPPSRADGITAGTEALYRAWACQIAHEMCIMLELGAAVSATSQTLIHRFYYRRSLAAFDVACVVMACVFLSAKLEESPRCMRDVINVAYHLKLRKQQKAIRPITRGGPVRAATAYYPSSLIPTAYVQLYVRWKTELMRLERHVLKELGFFLYCVMSHPQRLLLYFLKALGASPSDGVAQAAWNFANDSLRVDVCVRFQPAAIACACIALAAQRLAFPLPTRTPWFTVFQVQAQELADAAAAIEGLYSMSIPAWLPSLRPAWRPEEDIDVGEEADRAEAPGPARPAETAGVGAHASRWSSSGDARDDRPSDSGDRREDDRSRRDNGRYDDDAAPRRSRWRSRSRSNERRRGSTERRGADDREYVRDADRGSGGRWGR